MKCLPVMLKSLVLAGMLSGTALATESIDINTADAVELDRVLRDVGQSKARAIVDYRQANGPFKRVEDLALVKGIGLNTVERNRDVIKVGAGMAPARKAASEAARKPVETR